MLRSKPTKKLTALLVLAMLGSAGIALAQTATVKGREGSPEPRPVPSGTATVKDRESTSPSSGPTPGPATLAGGVPKAEINVFGMGRGFNVYFSSGLAAQMDVTIWRPAVVGGFTVLDRQSTIGVEVAARHDRSVAPPPGTYRIRLQLANVADDATLVAEANGTTQTCNIKKSAGYQTYQPCDLTFTTKGAVLDAKIKYPQDFKGLANFSLQSIEVTKIR